MHSHGLERSLFVEYDIQVSLETPLGHLFTRFLSFLGVLPRRFSSLPRELK